jgi:glycosyltransferase involved in cell wall biosynthesis
MMKSNQPKVLFNSWSGAFFHPGGGEYQLIHSENALKKRGIEISRYDNWTPDKSIDIFHQFSIEIFHHQIFDLYRQHGVKTALSTIMWTIHERESFAWENTKQLLEKADILFPNSNLEATRISQAYEIPIEKFHKTRNAISSSYETLGDKSLFRQCYNIPFDNFVLSVGHIQERKNTHLMVQACKELNIPLITIGHIRDIEYYKKINYDYPDWLHIENISSEEVLKSAYLDCDLFLLPSKCETPGLAALEAASQGCNILITNEGSTNEYFGDMVNYVKPDCLNSLINEIKHSLLNKSISNKKLRDIVTKKYTWDKTASDILTGYEKALKH